MASAATAPAFLPRSKAPTASPLIPEGFIAKGIVSATEELAYLAHARYAKESAVVVLLTRTFYYVIDEQRAKLLAKMDVRMVTSLTPDDDDACVAVVTFKKRGTLGNKVNKGFQKLFRSGVDASEHLETERILFDSCVARQEFELMFDVVRREAWQHLFERSLIKEPEVYQHHFLITKLNRKNKMQERVFCFSESTIFNVKIDYSSSQVKVKAVKWGIAIVKIKGVSFIRKNSVALTIHFTESPDPKKGRVNDYKCLLFDDAEREAFVRELQRLYYHQTKEGLMMNME